MLTTASNLLFAGGRDGQFVALDARDGELLWETNLGPSVSAGPMTYMVNGKQYVAVTTGPSLAANSDERVTPELRTGIAPNVFVFALP